MFRSRQANKRAAKIKHPEKTWQGHNPKTAGIRKSAEFGFVPGLGFQRNRVFTARFDSFQMPGAMSRRFFAAGRMPRRVHPATVDRRTPKPRR
jgi:hypothetical protein